MKKQKHRFNAVDAVILVLVVAVLAVGAFLLLSRRSEAQETTVNIEYVVELRTIRDEFTDNFEVGTKLIDSAKKYRLGDIIAVSVTPASFTGTDLIDGALVYGDYPEHSNVSLTVRAKAAVNNAGDYIIDGGYRISVGSAVYVRTPNFVGTGYCTKFKETEAR